MIRNVGIIVGRITTFYLGGMALGLIFFQLGIYSLYLIAAFFLTVFIAWSWDNEVQ